MIGWYVHAHGRGHLQRLQCIAEHLRTPVTGLSSLPRPPGSRGDWVDLPDDLPTGRRRRRHGGRHACTGRPRHHPGLRDRMAAIARWVADARPALVVVDVSVEVAVLVRALGVPVVVAAMRGERDRPGAHHGVRPRRRAARAVAGRAARAVAAALARQDVARRRALPLRRRGRRRRHPADRRVTVLWGAGGSEVTAHDVDAAQAATPGWTWDATTLSGCGDRPVAAAAGRRRRRHPRRPERPRRGRRGAPAGGRRPAGAPVRRAARQRRRPRAGRARAGATALAGAGGVARAPRAPRPPRTRAAGRSGRTARGRSVRPLASTRTRRPCAHCGSHHRPRAARAPRPAGTRARPQHRPRRHLRRRGDGRPGPAGGRAARRRRPRPAGRRAAAARGSAQRRGGPGARARRRPGRAARRRLPARAASWSAATPTSPRAPTACSAGRSATSRRPRPAATRTTGCTRWPSRTPPAPCRRTTRCCPTPTRTCSGRCRSRSPRDTWDRVGGFCERYTGYGGEDTDFGWSARAAGVPLWWVGGAWAYHQHHGPGGPPAQHLHDIVRNAGVFFDRHGTWPMRGWLEQFAEQGLARVDPVTQRWVV